MNNDKSLFIVTSAVYTSYGKISIKERILQTEKTIKSIRTKSTNSDVVLIDCGEKDIPKNLFDCEIINYSNYPEIKLYLKRYLLNNDDIEPEIIIKSMLEILMFDRYLPVIDTKKYKRIFKVNGRYILNEFFDYEKHLECHGKALFLSPFISQRLYDNQKSTTILQCMTRCWSFDSNILNEIINTFEKMKKEILYASTTKKCTDIEHLIYKYFKRDLLSFIDIIGIEGLWAPLNILIKE